MLCIHSSLYLVVVYGDKKTGIKKMIGAKNVNFVLVSPALPSGFSCQLKDPDGEQPCLST